MLTRIPRLLLAVISQSTGLLNGPIAASNSPLSLFIIPRCSRCTVRPSHKEVWTTGNILPRVCCAGSLFVGPWTEKMEIFMTRVHIIWFASSPIICRLVGWRRWLRLAADSKWAFFFFLLLLLRSRAVPSTAEMAEIKVDTSHQHHLIDPEPDVPDEKLRERRRVASLDIFRGLTVAVLPVSLLPYNAT